MNQTRSARLDDTRGHPDPAKQINPILHRVAPTAGETTDLRHADACWDRITAIVLCLLFEMTQQAARFGSGINPWGHLAAYDAEAFTPFSVGGPA